jgi:hypothetical protein
MTWLITAGGYEIFFNRDERRSRGAASPPAIHLANDTRYIAPLDGDFGGSWLAVNEHGLSLALENGYTDLDDLAHEPSSGFTSRGLLLTSLIDSRSTEEVVRRLREQDLHLYRSFLLVAFDPDGSGRLASWIRGSLDVDPVIDELMPLVSSSFETSEVRKSRRAVFRRMQRETEVDPVELHLAYHESHKPERGPRSTCMHRPDAHTVSFCHILVEGTGVRFHYVPHSPCRGRPDGNPVSF